MRDRQKQPDIALVVVIDQSGSMAACHCNSFNGGNMGGGVGIGGVQKVDIGKEAILRAAAALTERDQLGVVGFNEAAHWVVHTQPLGNITDLQGQIAGIRADGQTNIYAGLDQAVQSLETTTATRRHIILLTDGWSNSGQYDAIIAKMKADGITLSTRRRGRRREPVPRAARQAGRRPLLRGDEPVDHPGHLPQGDPAGLRPADRRGDLLPDPDVELADPARAGCRAAAAPRLQRDDDQVRRPERARHGARRPAPRPVAVRAGSVRGVDVRLDRPLGEGLGRLARVQPVLQPARQLDVPGRGDRRDRGDLPGDRRQDLAARRERRQPDGSPRDFYSTSASIIGPDLEPRTVNLVQTAPGVYEAPLGEIDAGAYAVRITQTRPGSSPLGRTVGLVAQTPAEYRQLGANEPFLASLRAATGGTVVATALDPWRHDLTATDRFTELWPLLLVLALLLWPLDIALRRMSLGRRELVAARGWVGGIGRRRRGDRAADPRPPRGCLPRVAASGPARPAPPCARDAESRAVLPAWWRTPRSRRTLRPDPRPRCLRRRRPHRCRRRRQPPPRPTNPTPSPDSATPSDGLASVRFAPSHARSIRTLGNDSGRISPIHASLNANGQKEARSRASRDLTVA